MFKQCFLSMFCVVFAMGASQAQTQPHELQCMMMLSFLKYIHWPSDETQSQVVIGVYGDDDIYEFLGEKYHQTTRYGKKVLVKYVKNNVDISDCNLLYLGESKSEEFEKIHNNIDGVPILLITSSDGLGEKGSCINFTKVGNKIRFELNEEALSNLNLKVSSRLTNLAILK